MVQTHQAKKGSEHRAASPSMRKLTTIIWHMLGKHMTYAECRARRGRESWTKGMYGISIRDLALSCQSRMAEGGILPPHSVLAPGTVLGLLRHVSNNPAKPLIIDSTLSCGSLTVDVKRTDGIDPHR